MQTSVPVSETVPETWTGLPYWTQLGVGFLLIGLSASIIASNLRAALPPSQEPGQRRALHYLYPPFFGSLFATLAPVALPGFGLDSRWLIGIAAPVLFAPLYDYLKKRYLSQLGIVAPEAKDLVAPNGETKP